MAVSESKRLKNSRFFDEVGEAQPDDLPMPAVGIIGRIGNHTGGNGVEVDVRDNLPEVIFAVDHPRPVAILPEPAQ